MAKNEAYRRHREQAAARQEEQARKGCDIGPIPPIKNPRRRKRSLASLEVFCKIYMAEAFPLAFSADHRKVIAKIERAVTTGGLFAEAMPRGSGKSTICEAACLWAALKGLRRFICLIGATADKGVEMVDSISDELEDNERLLEDFPEVVYPFVALEHSNNRASKQTCLGEYTRIKRTSGKLVFPTIPGSLSGGVVLIGTGIEGGAIRGARHRVKGGKRIRPDMIVCDDLQTDETALSPLECAKREKAITGKVLGTAGPGMEPAAIVCGTVIRKGDVIDSLLDRGKHPEWQGERMKLVYQFPDDFAGHVGSAPPKRGDKEEPKKSFWDEFQRLLREDFSAGGDGYGKAVTAHYRKNRKAMDAGAVVAWPQRKGPRDLSAIEHAMRLLFTRGRPTFYCEYQNDPIDDEQKSARVLTAKVLEGKLNGLARYVVPKSAEHLTAYVDVHGRLLYWLVGGWSNPLQGAVVNYGTYPRQSMSYFSQDNAPVTMQSVAKAASGAMTLDAWILAGLQAVTDDLLGRVYHREDGAEMRIGKLLFDAKWGQTNPLVKQFCRRHPQSRSIVMAAQGYGSGSRQKPPLYTLPLKPGTVEGKIWRIGQPVEGDNWVTIDTNAAKTLAADRLVLPMGTRGGLEIFGRDPVEHSLLFDHLLSEKPGLVTANGLTYETWMLSLGQDNHWWDCLVGAMIAAMMLGCRLAEWGEPRRAPKRRPGEPSVSYL